MKGKDTVQIKSARVSADGKTVTLEIPEIKKVMQFHLKFKLKAADGKVAGYGRIDGREVAIVSNDFTVLGASSSAINGKKIRHVRETATERGLPLIFLGESAGARMPDRMGAAGRAMLGQDPLEYQRKRETPYVSALLGDCYGSSTWYACLSDFVVMRKGATMAVASNRVTALAIGMPGCAAFKTLEQIQTDCERVYQGSPTARADVARCVREAQQEQFIQFMVMLGFIVAATYLVAHRDNGGGIPVTPHSGAVAPGGG